MLLFEGQTAFYEYEATGPHNDIAFDVKPLSVLGYSDGMRRVTGVGKGRLEFPVERTGLYKFQHGTALGRVYGRTTYSVTWGAR